MDIVILGTGNVATVFCRLIAASSHRVVQIVGRNEQKVKELANRFGASGAHTRSSRYADADLIVAALSDDILYGIDQFAALRDRFVVHTAGSVPMNVLSGITERYGVLYPLQTLSGQTSHLPQIPLFIDGNSTITTKIIQSLANDLSHTVQTASDSQRLGYHIAAVFVSNFSNHMFALAEKYCREEGLNYQALMPLLREVVHRTAGHSAFDTQTGPAVRNDTSTMQKHLEALQNYPMLQKMYEVVSKSILQLHRKH